LARTRPRWRWRPTVGALAAPAALLGATQFARPARWLARSSGCFANGTALPMVGVIALCGVGAWLLLRVLALRKGSAPRLAES
jgi:hypothetical protein